MTDPRDRRRHEELDLRLHAAGTPEPEEALKRLTLNRLRSEFAERANEGSERNRLAEVASAVRDVVATLVSGDGFAGAVGVRGGHTSAPRLMVWETEDHSFSVSFEDQAGGRVRVRGQVAPRKSHELGSGTAVLVQGSDRIEAEITATGQFAFPEVPRASALRLEVLLGSDRVQLGPVDLHAPPSE